MIVHVMDRKMSYYLLFNPFIFGIKEQMDT